ncbi:N-acetylmuramoyl-L-alanine amidase [Streptomyces bobili]|uniref:N-acetylmuramoyl-L-alanine amidase n=1 Tax=Streptomyces bobili TaxID=67280 RepID=UPI00344A41D5
MKLVTRAQWGARAYSTPNGATPYSRDRRGVKLHYLGTAYSDRTHDECDDYVRQLQAQHMDGNGWSDIGYSFLVCTHGYVYEGRGLKRRNSANGNTTLNEQDYAVCLLVGSSGLVKPTDDQLNGARDAIEHCRENGPAGDWLGGHRDGYATACPGDYVYVWVKAGAPRPTTSTPPQEDDMPTAQEIADAVWAKQFASPTAPTGTDPNRSAGTFLRWADVRHQQEMTQLAALSASVEALARIVGQDVDTEQVIAAVREAIADAVIKVDVDVTGTPAT